MRSLRRLHLYLGCFFAPMLVFFIASGWYQTVNRDRLKSPSEAETLPQKLRVLHTDHIYPSDREFQKPSSPRLFKYLIVAMSVALLVTTVLGIILAFKFSPKMWPVIASLVLGIAVPVFFLWLGRP